MASDHLLHEHSRVVLGPMVAQCIAAEVRGRPVVLQRMRPAGEQKEYVVEEACSLFGDQ